LRHRSRGDARSERWAARLLPVGLAAQGPVPRAIREIRETDLLQKILHDDLAEFVYDRLRRRPMVLPVVVEV